MQHLRRLCKTAIFHRLNKRQIFLQICIHSFYPLPSLSSFHPAIPDKTKPHLFLPNQRFHSVGLLHLQNCEQLHRLLQIQTVVFHRPGCFLY